MNLRMMELIAPPETAEEARTIVEDKNILGLWTDDLEDGHAVLRVLLDADQTEAISDTLSEQFGKVEGFRIMFFSVEATLPQPDIDEEQDGQADEETEGPGRVSREELYADVSEGSKLTYSYLAMVVLSTLVAAVGLIYDDIVAIIGAMVIAPLMGPNVAMALAVTLADEKLGWQSVKTNIGGLFLVFLISLALGAVLSINPGNQQFMSHTAVTYGDLTISIAAGAAGVLAYTVGVPATIIGVAVALALLPALVSLGLLLGAGYTELAIGSLILTVTNIISINLAGVATFLIQGVHPRKWWEEKKALKASRIALALWLVLLVVLAVSIWYWGQVDLRGMVS